MKNSSICQDLAIVEPTSILTVLMELLTCPLIFCYLFIYLFICLLCKCVCSVYVICNKIYTIQVTSSRLASLHSKQEKFILTKKVQSSENTNQACVIRSIFQQHTSQHTQQEKKSVTCKNAMSV